MLSRDDAGSAAQEYCVIRVKGHLAPRWSEWFDGLALSHTEDGETILCGPIADQAALHGLLAKICDLNLRIVSVMVSAE